MLNPFEQPARETKQSESIDRKKDLFEFFPGPHAKKEIDELSSEDQDLLTKNLGKIQELRQIGLITDIFMLRFMKKMCLLSPDQIEQLKSLAAKVSIARLKSFAYSPEVLEAFEQNDPRREIAQELLQADEYVDIVGIIRSKKTVQEILQQKDPKTYIKNQLGLLRRLKKVLSTRRAAFAEQINGLTEEKVSILEQSQDEELAMCLAEKVHKIDDPEKLREQLAQWKAILTPGLRQEIQKNLRGSGKNELADLIRLRSSWTKALLQITTIEELRELLNDSKAVKSFVLAGTNSSIISYFNNEKIQELESRERIPIEEEDAEGSTEMIRDIINRMGLESILKKIASKIILDRAENIGAAGLYSRPSAEMCIATDAVTTRKAGIPGVIIHEAAHGLENLLGAMPKGQELFDQYVVNLVYRQKTGTSVYPEALGKMEGTETGIYVSESFAEDMRVFFQNPELIPIHQRQQLESISIYLLPELDLEQAREKIRKMYGELFGVSVNEVQRPADCNSVTRFAQKMNQKRTVRKREFEENMKKRKELEQAIRSTE